MRAGYVRRAWPTARRFSASSSTSAISRTDSSHDHNPAGRLGWAGAWHYPPLIAWESPGGLHVPAASTCSSSSRDLCLLANVESIWGGAPSRSRGCWRSDPLCTPSLDLIAFGLVAAPRTLPLARPGSPFGFEEAEGQVGTPATVRWPSSQKHVVEELPPGRWFRKSCKESHARRQKRMHLHNAAATPGQGDVASHFAASSRLPGFREDRYAAESQARQPGGLPATGTDEDASWQRQGCFTSNASILPTPPTEPPQDGDRRSSLAQHLLSRHSTLLTASAREPLSSSQRSTTSAPSPVRGAFCVITCRPCRRRGGRGQGCLQPRLRCP